MTLRTLLSGPWSAARVLTSLLAVALPLAASSLVLLLLATPPYECGRDYRSPPTPLASGSVAIATLVFAVASLLVGIGLRLGVARSSADSPWATRAVLLAALLLLVAGGAVVAVIGRWSCWP